MSSDRGVVDWLAFVFVCASALLAAVLEVLFLSRFYIGAVIVPLVVLAAAAGNLLLPRLGFAAVGSASGAIVPVAIWLIVVLLPLLYNRPEGDVIVLAEHGQQYAYYGLLLVGGFVGVWSVMRVTAPMPPKR